MLGCQDRLKAPLSNQAADFHTAYGLHGYVGSLLEKRVTATWRTVSVEVEDQNHGFGCIDAFVCKSTRCFTWLATTEASCRETPCTKELGAQDCRFVPKALASLVNPKRTA